MSTPTIARVLPAVEPKPPVRQNIPGSTNYFFAGEMFDENGVSIHAECLESAEFCDCTPRYDPPGAGAIRANVEAMAQSFGGAR